MTISVLVATYNRAELLDGCLQQIARQAFRPGDQLIVVDNGSTDDTAAIVRKAQAGVPAAVTYLVEKTPGKSHALATALSAATGDIIALTDDDVFVGDDWLAVIRSLWTDEHARSADARPLGLAGGRVAPRWERQAPRWLRLQPGGYGPLAAPLALLDYGSAPAPLGARTALGANMAVARRALDAAGGFPLDLGKLRGTLLSGEDHQLCERVQAAGYRAVYEPRLAVEHRVPAERLRFSYHVRWFFWSGITNAALDRARGRLAASRPGRARYWAWRATRHAARALAAALTARPRACAEGVIEVAFSLGYLAHSRGWVAKGAPAATHRNGRLEAA